MFMESIVAATRQLRVFIGQKKQLTGRENVNNMRSVTCANTQTSSEWPYRLFPHFDELSNL